MISKFAREAVRPVLNAAARRTNRGAVGVAKAARREIGSKLKIIDKAIAGMSPKKLATEIERILNPDTALEVALATHKRGMKTGTEKALAKGMSLAYTLQGRDTVAKAATSMGFPEVGARHRKGLDKLIVGAEAEKQAEAYARRLAQVGKPSEMLRLWRTAPGALAPRTSLMQDVKSAASQAFTGEFALFGPIHFPSWAGESLYKHLGVFNRIIG